MIEYNCDFCSKKFRINLYRFKHHNKHFCCYECKAKSQNKKQYPCKVGICKWCKKDIIAKNSSFDKPNRKFCSKTCQTTVANKNKIWTQKERNLCAKIAHFRFKGKKLSLEQRLKRRDNNLGSKSHFWKGGITKENLKRRSGIEYKEWRKSVFERDNYTCQECGARSGKGKTIYLNADHIKPWALYPELRYEVSNGRTLCESCHHKTDTFGCKTNIMRQNITAKKLFSYGLPSG